MTIEFWDLGFTLLKVGSYGILKFYIKIVEFWNLGIGLFEAGIWGILNLRVGLFQAGV